MRRTIPVERIVELEWQAPTMSTSTDKRTVSVIGLNKRRRRVELGGAGVSSGASGGGASGGGASDGVGGGGTTVMDSFLPSSLSPLQSRTSSRSASRQVSRANAGVSGGDGLSNAVSLPNIFQ